MATGKKKTDFKALALGLSSELTTLCWQLTSRQGVPQQSSKAIRPAAHSERPTTLRWVLTYRHGNWCCKLTTTTNINLEWYKGASLHTLVDDSLICTGWPENESEMKWRSNFCIMNATRILYTTPEGTGCNTHLESQQFKAKGRWYTVR